MPVSIEKSRTPLNPGYNKLGHSDEHTWGAYLFGLGDVRLETLSRLWLFLLIFVSDLMLEIQSLSPLARLEPQAWVEHTE